MINETVLYLPHTNCDHPVLKKYAKKLDIQVLWHPDVRLGNPLKEIFADVSRYDVGKNYAEYGHKKTNKDIIDLVYEKQPKYVIWPTMSYEIEASTFHTIRDAGAYVIGWFFDDEMRFDAYSRWWIPYMDYIFTTSKDAVKKYSDLGASAFHLLVTSNPHVFKNLNTANKTYDVSFIGSANVSDRIEAINILKQKHINIHTFGSGWENGYIAEDQMVNVYNESKINLCFTKAYQKDAVHQLKNKIFDICMCSGFLLCEYVDGIEDHFEINKEIVCFDDIHDAIEKIKFYLSHTDKKNAIASAGYQRAQRDHSQAKWLADVFESIEKDTHEKKRPSIRMSNNFDMPEDVRKLPAAYHIRWAKVLFEEQFDTYRWQEELALAKLYDPRININEMCSAFKTSLKHNQRILLIQAAYPSSPFPAHVPIGLGYLAKQLDIHHIPYDVFDLNLNTKDNLFDKIKQVKPGYIGFSLMSLDLSVNYKTIKEIKAAFPEIKIIAGGPHISFMGEKALEECEAIDFGVLHEGEQALVDLLNNMAPDTIDGLVYRKENGGVHRNKNRAFTADIDAFLFPTFEKFALNKYGNVIQIASSRGCPYPCTFCGAHLSMGKTWRARSAENVFNEIAFWYEKGYRNFNFIDSNFFVSKKRVKTLCTLLEKKHMNISLSFDGMRLKDADPEILRLLKKFGLKHIAVGIESANDDTLAFIQKGETLDEIKKGMDILKYMDISVDAFFIMGIPGDTIRHIFNSFAFALNYPNIKKVYFFNVNPLPNTQLYKFAKENNLLAGSKNQTYQNIGGMGNDILMLSNDLSLEQQKILLQYSKIISRSVELNHLLYESEKKPMPHLDVQAVQAETKRLETFSNYYVNILQHYNQPPEKSFPGMENADKIFTHMTKEEKHKLYELALHSSGKVFVEIGSYLGASSCYIAEAIQSDPSKRLYCVDTWENDGMTEGARDTFDEFCSNTSSYADTIVPLRGKSLEVAQTFNLGIDYLFVDADHSYEAVKADMLAWLPKLNPGAIVICHDTGWAEGIQKAVGEVIAPVSINHDTLPNMYWTHIQSAQNIKATQASSILLSVIIPTRNRAQRLSIALESLTMQTYPEHLFEVIVVDNGSSDKTRDVCRKYENIIKNFQYVYVSEPGLHVARHTGWQQSCGEILVYGDDDIRASSTWLEGIAQCFKDPDVALAGGNILPEFEADPPEWLGKLWNKTPWGKVLGQYSLIDFGNHDSEISPMYVWGANFAIKKTVLSEAGGFHPDGMPSKLSRFRGDGETHISEFIQQHKYKTVHHSRATVFHWISKERMTVEYLYKRMFLQGISDSFTYIRSNKTIGKLKQYKNKPDHIEDALYKGHCSGYNYHHTEVKKDPELLKWVLQDTFFADTMTQKDCIYEEDIKQVNNAKKHILSKDYHAALQVLDQIGHISPHIKNLQYLRTLCLLNLGRHTEANEAALLELKFFPENSDCRNLINLFSRNNEKNVCNANKIKQEAI